MDSRSIIAETNKKYSSQYQGELATHLPMALVALEKLGASPSRLIEYRNNYVKRLEPYPKSMDVLITSDNWKQYLGENRFHHEYLRYFLERLEHRQIEEVLEEHLPILFEGVAGGAFHGLIRLGYALESQNPEEVAHALGYWAVSFLKLDAGNYLATSERFELAEIFSALHKSFLGYRPEAPNIARRLEIIGKLPKFQGIVCQVDLQSVSYKALAPVVLELFYQSQDFTALHAVTATHALRVVSNHLRSSCAATHCLMIAIAAAYVSIRSPKIELGNVVSSEFSWKDLAKTAIRSNDDHIPKIVYSCLEEYRVHADPKYFFAAKKYVHHS